MSTILVVGSSGTVGQYLVKFLEKEGHKVVRATSKTELSDNQVHLNLVTRSGLDKAFDKVDKAFFLSPPGYTNQHELLIPLIDEAKKRNLQKVVLMTAMGADAVDEAPMRQAEKYLEKSGLNYNIIRPNWFMQNFNSFWIQGILSQQKIFLPVGDAKGSFIDARDIAATAAKLLTTNNFDNQAFVLTGGESINHQEVAQIMSEVLGRKIEYVDVSSDEMRKALLQAGLPKDYTEFLLMILGFFKEGYSSVILDNVEKITGRRPYSFKQYVQDHRQSWS